MVTMVSISKCLQSWGTMVIVFVLLAKQLLVSANILNIRGVSPSKLGMYTGSRFRCLRDQTYMAADRVNDDVCDCKDGSDEPGTAACDNGTFYCANKGFIEKEISSTFVDDGVCDCCDGTDEAVGCNNSCKILGALRRRDLEDQLERYEAGAEARALLVTGAAHNRKEWIARINDLTPKVAKLKAQVSTLEEEMNQAQEKQKEAEDAQKTLEDQDPSPADEDEASSSTYDVPDYPHDDPSGAQQAAAEEAEPQEEHPDDVGKRIAAQWTRDPDAVGDAPPSEDGTTSDDAPHSEAGSPDTEQPANQDKTSKSVLDRLKGAAQTITTAFGSGKAEDAEESANAAAITQAKAVAQELTEASRLAVKAHNERNGELREAEGQLETVKKFSAHDYGPDSVYAALADQCFEVPIEEYTYKVCMFVKAGQVKGKETSLGTFSACEDGCSTMKYTEGQGCWQGPARSLTVHAVCGSVNQLLQVSEPEKCTYVATMATPAECTASVLKEVRDELKFFLAGRNDGDVKDEL